MQELMNESCPRNIRLVAAEDASVPFTRRCQLYTADKLRGAEAPLLLSIDEKCVYDKSFRSSATTSALESLMPAQRFQTR